MEIIQSMKKQKLEYQNKIATHKQNYFIQHPDLNFTQKEEFRDKCYIVEGVAHWSYGASLVQNQLEFTVKKKMEIFLINRPIENLRKISNTLKMSEIFNSRGFGIGA